MASVKTNKGNIEEMAKRFDTKGAVARKASGKVQPAPAADASEADLVSRMKMMQTLVLRQREIEKEVAEKDVGGGNALAEVLSCVRGLLVLFNERMRALPGPSGEIKYKYDDFRASLGDLQEKWDQIFSLENVREVITMSDGFAPHLGSPERAIRTLITQSIECIKEPAGKCADETAKVLHKAVAETLDGIQETWVQPYPELGQFCAEQGGEFVDAWRRKARDFAEALVRIEQSAPDHVFFREMARKRLEIYRQGGGVQPTEAPKAEGKAPPAARPSEANAEYLMGYLEKRTRNDQKWQRRWFVLSESRKVLYYFLRPESSRPQAAIPLDDVEVVEVVNTPRTNQAGPGAQCKVFRLQNKDRSRSILPHKKGPQPRVLTISAPNPSSKQEWVEAVRRCCAKSTQVEEQEVEAEVEADDSASQAGGLKRLGATKVASAELEGIQAAQSESEAESEVDVAVTHRDEVRSIVSALSARRSEVQTAREQGRPMHLVVPFAPPSLTADPERAYLEQMIASTRAYVENIFKQLVTKVPKAVSYRLVDECNRHLESHISQQLCDLPEPQLQALTGKDPAQAEHVAMLKAELEQVKAEVDSLLAIAESAA